MWVAGVVEQTEEIEKEWQGHGGQVDSLGSERKKDAACTISTVSYWCNQRSNDNHNAGEAMFLGQGDKERIKRIVRYAVTPTCLKKGAVDENRCVPERRKLIDSSCLSIVQHAGSSSLCM